MGTQTNTKFTGLSFMLALFMKLNTGGMLSVGCSKYTSHLDNSKKWIPQVFCDLVFTNNFFDFICFFRLHKKNLFYFPQHFLKSFVEAFSWSSLEALLKNKIQSSTCVFNKDKPFNFIPKHNINAFKIKILSKFKVQNTFFFKVKLAFYALCFTPTCE